MAKGEKGKEKGTMAKGKEKGEKGTVAKGKEKGTMAKGKEKGNTALEKENDNTEKGPKENRKGKEKGKEKGKGKATEMKTGKGKTKNDEEASGSKAGFWAWVPDDQFPSTYESQREWGRKSSWWSWSYSAHSYNEIHECSDESCSDSDTYDDEPNEVIELNSSSEDREESTPPHKKARTGDDHEGWYERHGVWVPKDGSHRFPPFDCWSSD